MIQKIQKWGNSLAVRLPKYITDSLKLNNGASVKMSIKGNTVIIEPAKPHYYRLEDLLSDVCKENIHQEIDTGPPTGNEVW